MNDELAKRLFNSPAGAQWRQVGVRHHHGICLPLFSLHSSKSCGIGEYPDLIPLIDWCSSIGLDVIQLLPLNDTGQGASPYSALSASALNPLHLGLATLPFLEGVPEYQNKLAQLRYWNSTHRVSYDIVRELKQAFLREYLTYAFPQIAHTGEYRRFLEEHKEWLEPYALFRALKEAQQWKEWELWPIPWKSPSENTYRELLEEFRDQVAYGQCLQYLCFKQLEEVKQFGRSKGVYLKGDVPILISRDSADVWRFRHLFLLSSSAGAPPDMYTRDGQNWGFPIYDWQALEKDEYRWWRSRLQLASHLYDLYRIDHIVGFFRIWAIPSGKSAREGAFVPADESVWIPTGKAIMEMMLKAAPILPIGEDLGVVPQSVKDCMAELGICGTKMMRWERRWEEDGGFIDPRTYHPETMTTVSTHDSDTLQLWWRHFPKEASLFSKFKGWDFKPFLSLDRHREILWDSHHSSSLFHINLLQEYLALFPELVSASPGAERINFPGKILDINWTYRFVPSIEQLTEHAGLKEAMKALIKFPSEPPHL